jgi:fumarylacetoacetate (FAA) hydrolase family protein
VECLPADGARAILLGRAWLPGAAGPAPVLVSNGDLLDVSAVAPTCSQLLELDDPVAALRGAQALPRVATVAEVLANAAAASPDPRRPSLLAPCDLQAVKASGVTFVASLLERVIEEQARGDAGRADAVRQSLVAIIGDNLRDIRPGSSQAAHVKDALIAQGAWSQYLEVGIGPDAEIFTKAQPMSAVGAGAEIGIHPKSAWNNPEPEIVLAVNSRGRIAGATLGNDVNLRDFEGRSALLLGKAKDNNASCAIGPFLRFFDASFTLNDIRQTTVSLSVEGQDGFRLAGASSIAKISRDPADLVAQMVNGHHRYPDGAVLFLGTMFAPVEDRDAPGKGFTHKTGDIVTIAAPRLGKLVNRMMPTDRCEAWSFGVGALMRNLAGRGLL